MGVRYEKPEYTIHQLILITNSLQKSNQMLDVHVSNFMDELELQNNSKHNTLLHIPPVP